MGRGLGSALAVSLLAACTGAISEPGGAGGDGSVSEAPDAAVNAPDADPSAPDADPAAPDAAPGAADATPVDLPDATPNPTCGDQICTAQAGETCVSCAADCDTTQSVCGNGECQSGETSATCEADCGPSPWPAQWVSWEDEVVSLINMHRAAGTDCPSGPKSPVAALSINDSLRRAAQLHSWDQSYAGYFDHQSCNGRSFTERAADQGTTAFAEVIAAGQQTPEAAVNSWLSSTAGHCDALLNGSYTEIGIGTANENTHIWTGMFR